MSKQSCIGRLARSAALRVSGQPCRFAGSTRARPASTASCSLSLLKVRFLSPTASGVFSQSLGEFALAAILYFAKDFRRMLRNQEAGRWEQFDVEEIAGQTVGIVGYGDIGRAVASRVHAMGMQRSGSQAACFRVCSIRSSTVL